MAFFEKGSQVDQAGLDLNHGAYVSLNALSSCLLLPSTRATGIGVFTGLIRGLEYNMVQNVFSQMFLTSFLNTEFKQLPEQASKQTVAQESSYM